MASPWPQSLASRLAASTLQTLPAAYFSLAKPLLAAAAAAAAGAPRSKSSLEASSTPLCDAVDFFAATGGQPAPDTPPGYATSPPSPQPHHHPPHAAPLSPVLALLPPGDGKCTACPQLELKLHLLTLENQAYLAQRDHLLQHPPAPKQPRGLLAFVIATCIRVLFTLVFLAWPWVRRVAAMVGAWGGEWRVRERGWKGVVMAVAAVREGGRRTEEGEWEALVRRAVEEIVGGVGEGVKEGLGVWGVKVE